MFSTLVLKQKEPTLTKRKFKSPSSHPDVWKNMEPQRNMAGKAEENSDGARKCTYHRKCEYSPTESSIAGDEGLFVL